MEKQQWFYFVAVKGGAVAKINNGKLIAAMEMMNFRRCRYAEYLEARKMIKAQQMEVVVEGKLEAEPGA